MNLRKRESPLAGATASPASAQRTRDCRILGAVGLLLAVLYGLLDIDFGKGPVPSAEAWRLGVAQPYVFSGLLLVALAQLMNRGVLAVRWLILLWCPLTIGGGILWANARGVVATSSFEFVFLLIPVSVFWIWVVRKMFFGAPALADEPIRRAGKKQQ